jgi:DhnA family fructose-bisphosphate aldolase class Ia
MRRLLPSPSPVPWLLTADYFASSVMPGVTGDEELHRYLWSVEDAVERGAVGLKCLLVFGQRDADRQAANVASVAKLVSESRRVGLSVMVEATLWGQRVPSDRQNAAVAVGHAARVAFELGADVIKIPIPDDIDALERLTEAIPVPIVLMGGPHVDARQLFRTLRDALDAGARGLALGRNVWASDDPTGFVQALKQIVHGAVSPADALEILRSRRLDTP